MAALKEVPLFPLKAILFPGQAMALHIFEERYKLMISTCLRRAQPVGIVLIREGEEVGGVAVPYPVGTLASITETDRQDDGQFDVMAVGQERFIIRGIVQREPYLIAQVEDFPPTGEAGTRALALTYRVRELLPGYVKALAAAVGTKVQVVNIPERPMSLAFLTALVLQIRTVEQQRLLEMQGVSDMLARELTLLQRETAVWHYMATTQQAQKEREEEQPASSGLN
jgi:uncharacterized protein